MNAQAQQAKSVAFDTTLTATGSNTGIVVPDELIEQLAGGKRPAVIVEVNGYEYRPPSASWAAST